MTSRQPIRVDYTVQFNKELKRLRKKYPHIRNDVEPLIGRLERGETPGDQVPGVSYADIKSV